MIVQHENLLIYIALPTMNVPVANTCRITNQKTVFISPGLAGQQQSTQHKKKQKKKGGRARHGVVHTIFTWAGLFSPVICLCVCVWRRMVLFSCNRSLQ